MNKAESQFNQIVAERVSAGRSRATLRKIVTKAGLEESDRCDQCAERIVYQAEGRARAAGKSVLKVVCNLYDDAGTWRQTVHFHEACYEVAGQPFGEVIDGVEASLKSGRPSKGIVTEDEPEAEAS